MCEKCRVTQQGSAGGGGGGLPIQFFFWGGGTFAEGQFQPPPPFHHAMPAMLKLYRRGHMSSSWKPVWDSTAFISWDEILTAVQRET